MYFQANTRFCTLYIKPAAAFIVSRGFVFKGVKEYGQENSFKPSLGLHKKETIGSVIIEILSFRQNKTYYFM